MGAKFYFFATTELDGYHFCFRKRKYRNLDVLSFNIRNSYRTSHLRRAATEETVNHERAVAIRPGNWALGSPRSRFYTSDRRRTGPHVRCLGASRMALFALFSLLSRLPIALARASFYSHFSTRSRCPVIRSTAAMVLRDSPVLRTKHSPKNSIASTAPLENGTLISMTRGRWYRAILIRSAKCA